MQVKLIRVRDLDVTWRGYKGLKKLARGSKTTCKWIADPAAIYKAPCPPEQVPLVRHLTTEADDFAR